MTNITTDDARRGIEADLLRRVMELLQEHQETSDDLGHACLCCDAFNEDYEAPLVHEADCEVVSLLAEWHALSGSQ